MDANVRAVGIGKRQLASDTDFEKVYAMLVEASRWLREKNLRQWQPAYPPDRFAREVASGLVWFWGDSSEPMATVTLYEARPDYYPKDIWMDENAVWYVCRLAVARRFSGKRVGELVLDSLGVDGRAAGVHALRLDVTTANPFLENYYASQGFRRAEVVNIFGEQCALLEKTIGFTQ